MGTDQYCWVHFTIWRNWGPTQKRWECHCFHFLTSRGIKGKCGLSGSLVSDWDTTSRTFQLQMLHSRCQCQKKKRCQCHWSVCLCHRFGNTQAADSSHPYNSTKRNGRKVHLSSKFLFAKNLKEEFWLGGLGIIPHLDQLLRSENGWPGLDHMGHSPWLWLARPRSHGSPPMANGSVEYYPKKRISQDIPRQRNCGLSSHPRLCLPSIFYLSKKRPPKTHIFPPPYHKPSKIKMTCH